MNERNRIFLRVGLNQLGKRRRGRLFALAAADSSMLDLIYLNFEDAIENSVTMSSTPILAAGDGTILDIFSNFAKWIIENQDTILAFIKAIMGLFGGF